MLEIDCDLVGKIIEMVFEMAEPDGRCILEWCNGVIIDLSKVNSSIVTIIWNKNASGKEIEKHQLKN